MDEPRWLTADEDRAWRGYRRMHLLLDLQVSRDLMRDSGLSDADYDVLSTLSETEGHRLRLTELADHMLWSKSRLSHHTVRMQQRGLVVREDPPDDGRGSLVVLTRQGLRTIQKAAPPHVASVRQNLIDLLTAKELAALDAISRKVIGQLSGE
jgi:DNA-binding MarR family transcriptional regulator